MVIVHNSRWHLNKKSAVCRASHWSHSTKYWGPRNTTYRTLTPFYGTVEGRKPVLPHFLQGQEAHLLERQSVSHLSFSVSSSSNSAKYASWNFYPRISVLASRRQLMCSHLCLPPSCPSVPSHLTYSFYGMVSDFLVTLLWGFSCLLETLFKYRWLKMTSNSTCTNLNPRNLLSPFQNQDSEWYHRLSSDAGQKSMSHPWFPLLHTFHAQSTTRPCHFAS